MNTNDRQYVINAFLIKYKIDIVLCQEHNIKVDYNLSKIVLDYDLYINTSILSKGGTAILIRKNSGITVINVQYHNSSRVIFMTIKINNLLFKILNVYGHSGSSLKSERDTFFFR